jgi:hypothetical protein
VIDHELAVEPDRRHVTVALDDVEGVPAARRVVGDDQRILPATLVVEEAAGAERIRPHLNLRRVLQVHPAVGAASMHQST